MAVGALSGRTGWDHVRPPVVLGRGPGDVAVADLGDRPGMDSLHLACRVIAEVVLSVWVFDEVALQPDPGRMGVTRRRDPSPSWTEDLAPTSIDALGGECMEVVAPMVRRIAADSGHSQRAVRRVAGESLAGHLRRLLHHRPASPVLQHLPSFLEDVGDQSRTPFLVRPDAGPPVGLSVPSVCCVLSRTLQDGACPTCPRRGSDEQRRAEAVAWLESLDPEEFRYLTGRQRVG